MKDDAFFELTQRSDMNHESGLNWWQDEYPVGWMKMQIGAMFKGDCELPLIQMKNVSPFS